MIPSGPSSSTEKVATPLPEPKKIHSMRDPKNPGLIIRIFIIDDLGLNKIITRGSETSPVTTVWLQLKAEKGRKRKIGVVTKSTKTMVMKRSKFQHRMRKGDAYGFNLYLLEHAKMFNTIRLSDEDHNWKIPVKDILEKGWFLYFKQQGFEVQKFMSITDLEPYLVHPKSGRRL